MEKRLWRGIRRQLDSEHSRSNGEVTVTVKLNFQNDKHYQFKT